MGILNYSTKIKANKTVGEIQSLLIRKGVKQINTEIENCKPSAIVFVLTVAGKDVGFRLPCNVGGVLIAMKNDRQIPRSYKTIEQAERTAWRIIKDWVEAQMAIIEAGQAVMEEVFLPYLVIPETNRTLFEVFQESGPKLLGE